MAKSKRPTNPILLICAARPAFVGLVRRHIGDELMSGDVFILINRRRDRIKLLMWDATGFALYCGLGRVKHRHSFGLWGNA